MFVNKINWRRSYENFHKQLLTGWDFSFFLLLFLRMRAAHYSAGLWPICVFIEILLMLFLFLFLSAIRWIWMNITSLTFILWAEYLLLSLLFPLYQGNHVQIACINWCCHFIIFIFIQNHPQKCIQRKKKIDSNQIKHLLFICVFAMVLSGNIRCQCGNINSNNRCKKGENQINEPNCSETQKANAQCNYRTFKQLFDYIHAYYTLLSKKGASAKKNRPQKKQSVRQTAHEHEQQSNTISSLNDSNEYIIICFRLNGVKS